MRGTRAKQFRKAAVRLAKDENSVRVTYQFVKSWYKNAMRIGVLSFNHNGTVNVLMDDDTKAITDLDLWLNKPQQA